MVVSMFIGYVIYNVVVEFVGGEAILLLNPTAIREGIDLFSGILRKHFVKIMSPNSPIVIDIVGAKYS